MSVTLVCSKCTSIQSKYHDFKEKPLAREVWLLVCAYLKRRREISALLKIDRFHYNLLYDPFLFQLIFTKHFPLLLATKNPQPKREEFESLCKQTVQSINGIFSAIDLRKYCFVPLSFYKNPVDNFISNDQFLCLIREKEETLVEVWEWETQKKIVRFKESQWTSLRLEEHFLTFRTKRDYRVVWDLSLDKVISYIKKPIVVSKIQNNYFYAASGHFDSSQTHVIQKWDLSTGKVVSTIELPDHQSIIHNFCLDGNQIWIAAHYCKFRSSVFLILWDQAEQRVIKKITLFQGFKSPKNERFFINRLKKVGNYLLVHEEWGNLCIYDQSTDSWIRESSSNVSSFQVAENFLYELKEDSRFEVTDLCSFEKRNLQICSGTIDMEKTGPVFSAETHRLLMQNEEGKLGFLDFSFPCLAQYSPKVVKNNLNVLESMKEALSLRDLRTLNSLRSKLNSAISKCLEKFAASPLSLSSLVRVQTELCLDLLLYGLHKQNIKHIKLALEKMHALNSHYLKELYKVLQIQAVRIGYKLTNIPETSNVQSFMLSIFIQTGRGNFPYTQVQAVQKFQERLESLWQKEKSLLAPLGIVTKKHYSNKLRCLPEFLEQVGIQSREDLKVLGIECREELYLLFPEEESVLKTWREQRAEALEKKWEIIVYLQQFSEKVEGLKMFNPPYDVAGEDPWGSIQKKIGETKEEIEDTCRFSLGLIQKFQRESHIQLIDEINQLIEDFNSFYRFHQEKILYAYLHQEGLVQKFQKLKSSEIDIHTLTQLAQDRQYCPRSFFQMGE